MNDFLKFPVWGFALKTKICESFALPWQHHLVLSDLTTRVGRPLLELEERRSAAGRLRLMGRWAPAFVGSELSLDGSSYKVIAIALGRSAAAVDNRLEYL
jgi:hypothetical protein